MSRNPVAAYTHRGGFRMGQVEFKDFLWEALLDPAPGLTMGGTARTPARRNTRSRARRSTPSPRAASTARSRAQDFHAGEITPVTSESFACNGYAPRGITLPRKVAEVAADTHVRPSPVEALAQDQARRLAACRRAATARAWWMARRRGWCAPARISPRMARSPLGRIVAGVAVGCPPEVMGIGPVPAIRALLERSGLALDDIDRVEINEAFGAQVMACARALGLDEEQLNVNGGAIAIGHPLAATGLRLATSVARELKRCGGRWGIASACIGGGQGIALLIENADAA